ncbi:hypothetical protein HAT2_00656 [Candidatus Similichlamydia laticola]|uniref:Uncharacterized protein n=1 Tax=Candidatus Similichlamydia laticola TaxID=2170265 RepID=A0A369K9H7_9BACT|nr:hypothetical protein HAT2_00656 [Candidatus Similichlamydia laticola]
MPTATREELFSILVRKVPSFQRLDDCFHFHVDLTLVLYFLTSLLDPLLEIEI